jgi:Zn-dependent protease with chaperone function
MKGMKRSMFAVMAMAAIAFSATAAMAAPEAPSIHKASTYKAAQPVAVVAVEAVAVDVARVAVSPAGRALVAVPAPVPLMLAQPGGGELVMVSTSLTKYGSRAELEAEHSWGHSQST